MSKDKNGIANIYDLRDKCKGFLIGAESAYRCPTKYEIEGGCIAFKVAEGYATNQCVKFEDVTVTGTVSLTVTVFNDKDTNANLGGDKDGSFVKLQVSTDKSTWVDIAKTGTSQIPSNDSTNFYLSQVDIGNPSYGLQLGDTQYYFRITCGRTDYNQRWWYKLSLDDFYTECDSDKIKTGYTPAMPLQQLNSTGGNSLLGSDRVLHVWFKIT